MPEYKWKPIEGIPDELLNYADEELAELFARWQNAKKDLNSYQITEIFNRLKREWAIETGKIENLYTLSRGITETLIVRGLETSFISHNSTNKSPELVHSFIENQYEVIDGLFDFVRQRRKLTNSYICEMHQVFTKNQDYIDAKDPITGQIRQVRLLKGQWKTNPNNPSQRDGTIHEYAPPEQVSSQMDTLISWHQIYTEKGIAPEMHAAWLHHAFTQIHPFQDGNGRIARALASLIFIKAGHLPFVVRDTQRFEYINSLEIADFGNLAPLIRLFSESQKDDFLKVLNFQQDILIPFEDELLPDKYEEEKFLRSKRYSEAKQLLENFGKVSLEELTKVKNLLNTENLRVEIGSGTPSHPNQNYIETKSEFSHLLHTKETNVQLLQIDGFCLSDGGIPAKIIVRTHFVTEEPFVSDEYPLTGLSRIQQLDFRESLKLHISRNMRSFYSKLV